MGKCGAGNYVESVVEGPMHLTPSVVLTSPFTEYLLSLHSVRNSMPTSDRPCPTISEAALS